MKRDGTLCEKVTVFCNGYTFSFKVGEDDNTVKKVVKHIIYNDKQFCVIFEDNSSKGYIGFPFIIENILP